MRFPTKNITETPTFSINCRIAKTRVCSKVTCLTYSYSHWSSYQLLESYLLKVIRTCSFLIDKFNIDESTITAPENLPRLLFGVISAIYTGNCLTKCR